MNNNISYWEKLTKEAPTSFKIWFEGEREFLRTNIKKDDLVLDIGCGEGRTIGELIDITHNITLELTTITKQLSLRKKNSKKYLKSK